MVMKGPELFKVSMLTCALAIAGCGGGDINLNVEGETVEVPKPTTPPAVGEELAGVHSPSLSATVSAALGKEVIVQVLSGRITSDTELTADAFWALDGAVFVGDDNASSATLTVHPGAVVFGNSGKDYLVVSRGSKIEATGTKNDPIIMTSLQDVVGETTASGQWGGVVLLGNARTCSIDIL